MKKRLITIAILIFIICLTIAIIKIEMPRRAVGVACFCLGLTFKLFLDDLK